jgi:HD superfamily phosphohydrolase
LSKKKIFNDPVYGFITIPSGLVFEIIEHPYFQRLRRIRQLGLTDFVYPGALHTRFHHALGAMHLMSTALDTLRAKGTFIWDAEYEASLIAILLHDVGHGPFSHALETAIFKEVHHESISLYIMELLNKEFDGRLDLAIRIFQGNYERPFFHQLVSSQLDVDRLDYLNRDSFYTGVMEGKIGANRLLKMLDVVEDKLVVEEKAIYSIENFLVSRRLMYWQVYLHKTVLSAENMMLKTVERARELMLQGIDVPASPSFKLFLANNIRFSDFQEDPEIMRHFVALDDVDVWAAVKQWAFHEDKILSFLASSIIDRKLFKIIITSQPIDEDFRLGIAELIQEKFGVNEEELPYIMISGKISNNAYNTTNEAINVQTKYGNVVELAEASDLPNIRALSNKVEKFFVCYPKEIAG